MDKDDNTGVFIVGLLGGAFFGFLAGTVVETRRRQREEQEIEEWERSNPRARRSMNPRDY